MQPLQNSTAAENINTPIGRAIVFIDTQVEDWQILAAGVAPGTEVVILEPQRDGVAQITEVLQSRQNLGTLHILSHGSAGSVRLGNTWLNGDNLDDYADLLQQWQNALTADADILLYGCNVALAADDIIDDPSITNQNLAQQTNNPSATKSAANDPSLTNQNLAQQTNNPSDTSATKSAANFLPRFAQLTGADIAASDDFTGSAALGGDWDLEVATGEIEAPLAFQTGAMNAYKSVLASYTVAGVTWDDANAVTTGSIVSGGAAVFNFSAAFPETSKAVANILFTAPNDSVNVGDNANRGEIELTWGGLALPNNAGNDFVIYERGNSGFPEAFAVAVRKAGSSTFTTYRYEYSDSFDNPSLVFATGFDLSDFGLASNEFIDAIRIENLLPSDLVIGADGQGFVGGTNTPQTGPQGFGTFPSGNLDPDISYVAGLHNVVSIPTVSIAASGTPAEGGATGTFTVTRTNTTGNLTVNFTVGGTATFGALQDYTETGTTSFNSTTGSVTIPNGQSSIAFTINALTDAVTDPNETVKLILTSDVNYAVDAAQNNASLTITDVISTPTVSLTATDTVAEEGNINTGTFRITRTSSTGTLAVQLTPDLGIGTDYNLSVASGGTINASGTVFTFNNGIATADITFTAIDDIPAEASETFALAIANDAAYITDAANNKGSVTIQQNDFAVTNTNDSGEGSLRQAILNANAIAGTDTVTFNITGAGPHTISPTSALPDITEAVVIDGYSQAGASKNTLAIDNNAKLMVVLDGTNAGKVNGLTVNAGSSTIRGLTINHFQGEGVLIQSSNNFIIGNFIGTDASGSIDRGNSLSGVTIGTGTNNTIGGTSAGDRNVISGNEFQGITIFNGSNTVTGNYIGTDASGTKDLGNTIDGLQIQSGSNTFTNNLISGNDRLGIYLVAGNNNKLEGNYIGTNAAGTAAIANNASGVYVVTSNNTIGGTTAAARNVISGNIGDGISLVTTNATGNQIQGNYIGTNAAGTNAIANTNSGIAIILGANNNSIGSTSDPLARNVISGNGQRGVFITDNGSDNTVAGNYIGTDAAGTGDIGNSWAGIALENNSSATIIRNNTISNNDRQGNTVNGVNANVQIFNSNNNTVAGNFIGTNATGTGLASAAGNGGIRGIQLRNTNTIIGGTTASDRNIISGNSHVGVEFVDTGLNNSRTIGNYIGTDVTGNNSIANGEGVSIYFAPNVTIGGTGAGEGNVISGNARSGVLFVGNTTTNSRIIGNYIGTNAAGTSALGNTAHGVYILDAPNNIIGGTNAVERNIISGNGQRGVDITGSSSSGNTIAGNYIGTNAAGTGDIGNTLAGIILENNSSGTIVRNNTISNNDRQGNTVNGGNANVQIYNSNNNTLAGNFIGTNPTGTGLASAAGNGGIRGIQLSNTNTIIGGTTASDRNIISGNSHVGVEFVGTGLANSRTVGNYIGTNVTGNNSIANGDGIQIYFAPDVTIGGAGVGEGNVISGNARSGVLLTGNTTTNSRIIGNYIGTDASGTIDLGNAVDGVQILSSNNIIGGSNAGDRNIISGNDRLGVSFFGNDASNNKVQGNYIGTNVSGTAAVGNTDEGIWVQDASNNIIGGTNAGERNIISGNKLSGVAIVNPASTGNSVQGNYIGTDVTGTGNLGNNGRGVTITGNNNIVGGTTAGAGNTIAYNANFGVRVNVGTGNRIQGNSIFSNNSLGIELAADGTVTPNDTGDADTGSNNFQNFPIIVAAEPVGGNTAVLCAFNSTANTTFNIEFFSNLAADPSGNGEGQTYRGATTVTTDASGNANFIFNIAASLLNQFITATATDPNGNTSEFSNARQVIAPTVFITPANISQNEGNAGTTAFDYFVTLSQPSSQDIAVNYTTNDGTATIADSDYIDNDGSITFTAGNFFDTTTPFTVFDPASLKQTLTVAVKGDTNYEPDENFTVVLNSANNATIDAAQNKATGIIINDDLPTVSFTVGTQIGAENIGTMIISAQLNAAYTKDVTVPFTISGTATDGKDYTITTSPITITAGSTKADISINVIDDTLNEDAENVIVTMGNPTNAVKGLITEHTATITDNDPLPNISIDDISITEGTGGTKDAIFTVSLDTASGKTITVDYLTADITAINGKDYTNSSGKLTFNTGDTKQTITVPITTDSLDELDEKFYVELSNSSNASIADKQGIGTITDDDNQPNITINDVIITEGTGGTKDAIFTVTLDAASGQTITVDYVTADDTTINGKDYTLTKGTLTFNAGDTKQTITVPITTDSLDEVDEKFFVNLSNASNSTITDDKGIGAILDDDNQPNITIDDVIITEGTGGTKDAIFTVSLDAASGQTVTVDYVTADDTATNGKDYTLTKGTLTFNAGDTKQTITVPITTDSLDEIDEKFFGNLSNSSNASIGDKLGIGTITDDDNPPNITIDDVIITEGTSGTKDAIFTVSLDAASGQTVTVDYVTADDSAIDSKDYTISKGTLTFNAGDTKQTITVPITTDSLDEIDEKFFVNLSNANNATITDKQGVGTITDDDNPPNITIDDVIITEGTGGTKDAIFTVSLDAASGQTITVDYLTADDTAINGKDYTSSSGKLTFNPGDTKQTITIPITTDNLNEIDEKFFVNLSNANNATITDNQGIGSIANDDAQPTISLTNTNISLDEGNSGTVDFTFNVSLSAPSGQIIAVDYSTTDDTAKAGTDYIFSSGTLTFNPGDTKQTITVKGNGDNISELDEKFKVILSNPVKATIGGTGEGIGTIKNDDTAGFIVNPTTGLTTSELGSTATFTVRLKSQPTDDVIVNLTSSNTNEGITDKSSITFTAANWNTDQTVTVKGVDDNIADGSIAYSIITAATSKDSNYNTLNPDDVFVTNTDNDVAGYTINPTAGLTTTEAGGTATFSVRLNTQPTDDVTINLSSSNSNEGITDKSSVTFTAANWNNSQTVTVKGVDDSVADGNIAYSIITTSSSKDNKYNALNPDDISVTNTDNDKVGISVTPTTLTTSESGTTATFTVKLDSQPTADVSFNLSSSDAAEGTLDKSSLTFTAGNWNTAQTVTITGKDDFIVDGNKAYQIITAAATSTDNNYNNLNPVDVNVTNTDNDIAGFIINPTSLTTSESGTNATFTVKLSSEPTANVTFGLTSNNTAEGTIDKSSLTFTAGNWNTAQTVTITGKDDFIVDGDKAYQIITAAATSTDSNYNNLNPTDINVTNTDNDTANISITPAAIAQNEGHSGINPYTFTVNLSNPSNQTITVAYTTDDVTATAGSDYIDNDGTVTFNPGDTSKNITINVLGDLIIETDETFTVNLTNATNGVINNSAKQSTVTIFNEDEDDKCFCSQVARPNLDTLTGLEPNVVNSTINGTNNADTLTGSNPNEALNGFDGDDLLLGNAGNDNLMGFPGNDSIFGGSDRDFLSGNQGEDLLNGNAGTDILNGNEGNDTVRGGTDNDFIRGGKDDDIIWGDRGDDTLSGDKGNDTLFGGNSEGDGDANGQDLLFGGTGSDLLNGNAGKDTLFGEDGDDTLRGGKNDDIVIGDAGDDMLFGDKGNDSLCGGEGNDTIFGGNGSNVPVGANGEGDCICGGKGNDLLFGNEGIDKINGQEGDDTLVGGKDNDTLSGGAGNDLLFGDLGNDILRGGSGSDRFFLTPNKATDFILDFENQIDIIQLGGNLSFAQLNITQSNNDTFISVTQTGEILAMVKGVQMGAIGIEDFVLN